LAVPELHPETQQKAGHFIAEIMQLVGNRLKRAIVRVSNPRAGGDPMADIEVLLVVDDLQTRELYKIWNLTGDACIKYQMIFSVHPYSSAGFEERKKLPAISAFLNEGIEYDLQ
jgi:hypothetical protein